MGGFSGDAPAGRGEKELACVTPAPVLQRDGVRRTSVSLTPRTGHWEGITSPGPQIPVLLVSFLLAKPLWFFCQ